MSTLLCGGDGTFERDGVIYPCKGCPDCRHAEVSARMRVLETQIDAQATEIAAMAQDLWTIRAQLAAILDTVQGIYDVAQPIVNSLQNSPILKMLGG